MEEYEQEIKVAFSQLAVSFPRDNFPSDVHKWMKANANPKMVLKLMQVCKYFQHKDGFPFLVFKKVLRIGNIWKLETLDGQSITTGNLEEIPGKFWLTEKLDIYFSPTAVSTLLLKTVVCNVRYIQLTNQHITFNEFKLITDGGNVEECDMMQTVITYGSAKAPLLAAIFETMKNFLIHDQIETVMDYNDKIVPLEDICECLPNARIINVGSKSPSIFSLEAAETKISSKLESLTLWISPNFDLQKLLTYMKSHQQINYSLWFYGITEDEYLQTSASAVDEVFHSWPSKYNPPKVYVTDERAPSRCFLTARLLRNLL